MNMFKPVKAKTVKEYFASLPPERRQQLLTIDALIRKAAPKLKPYFANNMPGYGSFKCRDYKKRIIDWPVIALASQKNYISIFVCSAIDGQNVAEMHKHDLGKVDVGRSCIRFKKIDDVDLGTLKKVVKLAARSPGFGTPVV